MCGVPKKYKSVNGLGNVPLVTCIRCQRSLLANGVAWLSTKRAREQKLRVGGITFLVKKWRVTAEGRDYYETANPSNA